MSFPTHLIIVCCHAIYYLPSHPHSPLDPLSETHWLLAPFQTSESQTFTTHLLTALKLLLSPPIDSLLVLSGSKTRPEVEISEAASYLSLLVHASFFGLCNFESEDEQQEFVKEKIMLEEQTLDSFGNILYSLIAFWRRTGKWPERMTVVTMWFKKERILKLHFGEALRWPVERMVFVGVDPEYMDLESGEYDEERSESVRSGERERGFAAWEGDSLGTGPELRGKRVGRNFWGVGQSLFLDEQERQRSGLKTRLLEGGEEILVGGDEVGRFPWEESL